MDSLLQALKDVLPAEVLQVFSSSTALVVAGTTLLLFTFASCRIFSKAGYPAALGLLVLVPVINVMMFLGLAFGSWPVEQELRSLRSVERAVRRADQRHLKRVA